MIYTQLMMEEDNKQPEGTLKRTIIVDETNNIAEINILRKRGFSWEKTRIGVSVMGYSFVMFDARGNKLLEAKPGD